jgi:hypothetical protein
MSQRYSFSPEHATSLHAMEEALQPLGGFEKVWPEFVLHNWNGDPVDDYQKLDHMASRPKERGDTFLTGGAVDKYAPLNAELPHISASYKHFVFNDQVRSVAFLNGLDRSGDSLNDSLKLNYR